MDSDDIAILKVVTEIQGHGEGELVAGAFINKPIRSGMVVQVEVGAFEVYASKTHDLLAHLTGGQVIAKDAIISEGLKRLAVVGMMGCSGRALLVFVQHGQRDGYPMEVPKVAVVFLEKNL